MSFWATHGIVGGLFFLLFLLLLPRFTMVVSVSLWTLILSGITTIGLTGFFSIIGYPLAVILTIVMWVATIFYPRIVIACVATLLYAETNLELV